MSPFPALTTNKRKYKDAILAKRGEVEKFTAKLEDIPIAEMLGTEAKDRD